MPKGQRRDISDLPHGPGKFTPLLQEGAGKIVSRGQNGGLHLLHQHLNSFFIFFLGRVFDFHAYERHLREFESNGIALHLMTKPEGVRVIIAFQTLAQIFYVLNSAIEVLHL